MTPHTATADLPPAAAGIRSRGFHAASLAMLHPPRWMMAAALVLALVLLAWFYAVLNQAVARAHTHWAAAATPATVQMVHGCGGQAPHACLPQAEADAAVADGFTTALLTPTR